MTHLDLFSGIGGFALAAQTVWGSDYHCVGFCEIDPFCQQVLRQNFKGVRIYGDIRGLTTERLAADINGPGTSSLRVKVDRNGLETDSKWGFDLLTGGFPCQPFSVAGKRQGTEDDRWLWPEMLRVVREVKPRWIIGENVPGIIEMALGQVVADMEGLGYEVQCFVIPACAVNAPHRRDRVWIVAHAANPISRRCGEGGKCRGMERIRERGQDNSMQTSESSCSPSSDTLDERLQRGKWAGTHEEGQTAHESVAECGHIFPDWSRDWREVAALTCVHRVDDGLPRRVVRFPDGSSVSESKWRQEALKCYGNAIVSEVAMELMKCIRTIDERN